MWQEKDNKLTKILTLENFSEVIKLVNKIADIAESQNHHPDLKIFDYKNLEISVSTHDAGKVTEKDHLLAKAIDDLLDN